MRKRRIKCCQLQAILCAALLWGLHGPLDVCAAAESSVEGFSQPYRTANLAAAASGVVADLLVQEGQAVRAGEVLVELDARFHEVLVTIAETAMKSTGELQSALAERKLRRQRIDAIRALAERGHANEEELSRVETEMALAEARVRSVKEKITLLELEHQKLLAQAENYLVRAPFDGVVTQFHKQPGEYVGPVEPQVCTLVDLGVLSVDFLTPRSHNEKIVAGMKATVLFIESNQEATGTVYFVSPFPDGETNTYTVKVRVANREGRLSAGERCRLIGTTPVNDGASPEN